MTGSSVRAGVTVTPRPLWRLRLDRRIARGALCLVAAWGVAASARYAIAPPRPLMLSPAPVDVRDVAAEGFAQLFARRYLTWSAADPAAHQSGLAPFVGDRMDADAGLQPPASGSQRVLWTELVQARRVGPGEHVYTVAAETDTAGLLYLTVDVARGADRRLSLVGYPAFVGAPATGVADGSPDDRLRDVTDSELVTVVQRGLANYLGGAVSDLEADLSAGARVSLPGMALELQRVQQLRWSADGGSVLAVVDAADRRGALYTLRYALDVVRVGGRWEISAVQMDPNA
jgi:hypothetical protein